MNQIGIDPQVLIDEYRAYKVSKVRSFSGPSQANRCSVLGHPCTAYCFFDRTVTPKDRRELTPELAAIFDEGKNQEKVFQRDLLDMGWEVEGGQGSLSWPKFNITGHRDFVIARNGSEQVRCEFKSIHPNLFERLNEPKDFKGHKSWFISKWYYQTVLYMLLDAQKKYWLILKNKSTGQPKVIVFEWNDEILNDAEEMLKKAVKVNQLVQLGGVEVGDKIARPEVCSGCEFLAACNPPLDFGEGVEVLEQETAAELAELADQRAALEPQHKAFEEADEELKARVKQLAGTAKEALAFGDWAAQVKRTERKEYTVKAQTVTSVKFQRLVKKN